MTDTAATHHLFDVHTGSYLGPATAEQVAASDASEAKGELGGILIDGDGDPVSAGSWEAQQPGVRGVYTQAV